MHFFPHNYIKILPKNTTIYNLKTIMKVNTAMTAQIIISIMFTLLTALIIISTMFTLLQNGSNEYNMCVMYVSTVITTYVTFVYKLNFFAHLLPCLLYNAFYIIVYFLQHFIISFMSCTSCVFSSGGELYILCT